MNKTIPIIIIIAGILIAGAIAYSGYSKKCPGISVSQGEIISIDKVAEDVLNYINQNILRGAATASLAGTTQEYGLYKITIDIQGTKIDTYATPNGKLLFPEGIKLTEAEEPVVETGTTIGDFSVTNDEVCRENNKPIVYFFGSESCPHCVWEHPIIEEVAGKFGDYISFHNKIGDMGEDKGVFSKYSTGGVPTLVLGCKYYRVGSGERSGKEEESKVLTALICKLTNNQPDDVCSQVQDLIDQI